MTTVAPTVQSGYSVCGKCRTRLPLRNARADEVAENWICNGCGAQLHGILLSGVTPDLYGNVRKQPRLVPHASHPNQVATQPNAQSVERRISQPGFAAPKGYARQAPAEHRTIECPMETRLSRMMDSLTENQHNLKIQQSHPAFLKEVNQPGAQRYQEEEVYELEMNRTQAVEQLETLITSLENGSSPDVGLVEDVTRQSISHATKDLDLFVRLGINPPEGSYPIQHSLHVAMLASSIGINLGWDETTVKDIGIGCILHDLGMTQVPDEVYRNDQSIDDERFADISKHPLYTFDILEAGLSSISMTSRMVAYQIHERCNGSGYPRRRKSSSIHPAARVAAIADVYVALVSPRPHRAAMIPYHAVLHLLYGVRSGHFDSLSVRYLLETISLFPIGSFVELSDGRVGRVLRVNRSHWDRPIIEAWKRDRLDGPSTVVDLLCGANATVVRALPSLTGY